VNQGMTEEKLKKNQEEPSTAVQISRETQLH
jgi:hypothetical protein